MSSSLRAVIYARVSTDEQASNYSLPTQLAASSFSLGNTSGAIRAPMFAVCIVATVPCFVV